MKNREAIKKRYLKDDSPVQLGGIAANLARIKTFSKHSEHKKVVESLVEESKFFIEWSAPGVKIDLQTELLELQRILARLHYKWDIIWEDLSERSSIAKFAEDWANRLLMLSGLLVKK